MKKLLYIEWVDTTSPMESTWWTEEDAIKWAEDDSYWVRQVGFLLKETKQYILLAGGESTTKTGEDIIQYQNIIKIPKTWIRNRKIINLK